MPDQSFFDHCTSIDRSRWDEVGSSFAAVGSYFDVNGVASSARFLRYSERLSLTQSWLWAVCLRVVDPTNTQPAVNVWSDSGGAAAGATAALDSQRRLRVELQPDGLRYIYWDRNGNTQYWSGSAWQTTSPATPPQSARIGSTADWYTVLIEYDQPNNRVRFIGVHQEQGSYASDDQGYRVISETTWLDTGTDFDSWNNLYFTIGQRYTDGDAFDFHTEWIKYLVGDRQDFVSNNRDGFPDEYKLVVESGIDGSTLLTEHTEIALALQAWENGTQGRRSHPALLDGSTRAIMHESFVNSDADTSVGEMSATDPHGAWTPAAGNPLIEPSDIGANYSDLRPAKWEYDLADQKYRVYLGAEYTGGANPEYRCFLFESTSRNSGYTKVVGPGTDGAIIEKITPASGGPQFGVDGFSDPVVKWDPTNRLFHCFPAGYRKRPSNAPWQWADDDRAGWAIFHWTSPDRVNWTIQNGSLPIIMADRDRIRNVTATDTNESTSRMSVDDTTAAQMAKDWPGFVRDNTGPDMIPTRIREVINSTTVELYHWPEGLASGFQWARIDSGSITCSDVRDLPGGGFEMSSTVFQPFINTPNGGAFGTSDQGDFEGTMRLTASTLDGSWTWDLESGIVALGSSNGSIASKENISSFSEPIDTTLYTTTLSVGTTLTTPTLTPGNSTIAVPTLQVGAQLASPALVPGAVDLPSTTLQVGARLATPALAAAPSSLDSTSFSVGPALATPALTPGGVTIGLTSFTVGAQLESPALVAGAVDLPSTTLQVGARLATPTLVGGSGILLTTTLSVGSSLLTPSLAPGAVAIEIPSFQVGAVLTDPIFTSGSTILVPTLVVGARLAIPTLEPGAVAIEVPSFRVGAVLSSPTLNDQGILETTTLVVGTSLATPSLSPGALIIVPPSFQVGPRLTTPTLSSVVPGLLTTTTLRVGVSLGAAWVIEPGKGRAISECLKLGFAASLSVFGETISYSGLGQREAIVKRFDLIGTGPDGQRDGFELWITNDASLGVLAPAVGDRVEVPAYPGSAETISLRVDEILDDSNEARWHLGAVA